MVKKVTEAIISEERKKQHTILADKIENELNKNELIDSSNNNINLNTNGKVTLDYRAEKSDRRNYAYKKID